MNNVLGSAGILLTFTRTQEGSQPPQLTQTGQTNMVSDTVCHHGGALCGAAGWRRGTVAQEHAGHRAVRETCSVYPLFCIFFKSVLLLLLFATFAVL